MPAAARKGAAGRLVVGTTPEGDTPAMDDMRLRGTPLLVQDLRQQARYLGSRNEQAKYPAPSWTVADRSEASRGFSARQPSGQTPSIARASALPQSRSPA